MTKNFEVKAGFVFIGISIIFGLMGSLLGDPISTNIAVGGLVSSLIMVVLNELRIIKQKLDEVTKK